MNNYAQCAASAAIAFLGLSLSVQSQKTLEDVIIVAYEPPFTQMTVLEGEDQRDYKITPETKLINKKKKPLDASSISVGSIIDLDFKIENRERFAKKIRVTSNEYAGEISFFGVLEMAEKDWAIVDGRRIKLSQTGTIVCASKKCGCKKNQAYVDFSEVHVGDFLYIKGTSREDEESFFYANTVEVCENQFSKVEKDLFDAVDDGYRDRNVDEVPAPQGLDVPTNTLYQGEFERGKVTYKLVEDTKVQAYVTRVGMKVVPAYAKSEDYEDDQNVTFRFYVLESPVPNAYAFPNGMVFVHTGLLELIDNEAQLAAVLGHEIAHVTYEHAADRYETEQLLKELKETVRRLPGGRIPGGKILERVLNFIAEMDPGELSNLFEKHKESQADRVGLSYLQMAGYDPREAAQFWKGVANHTGNETFQQNLKNNTVSFLKDGISKKGLKFLNNIEADAMNVLIGTFLQSIYTSHPLSEQRLEDINQLLLTTYANDNFESYNIGRTEYREVMAAYVP